MMLRITTRPYYQPFCDICVICGLIRPFVSFVTFVDQNISAASHIPQPSTLRACATHCSAASKSPFHSATRARSAAR